MSLSTTMLSWQRFQSSEDADQAIQSLDGTDYLGQRITVEVRVGCICNSVNFIVQHQF